MKTTADITGAPRIVRSHDVSLDAAYAQWIAELKKRYRAAQTKAYVKVNVELLAFYWGLGRDLVVKKAEERWGAGIVEQVSLDLKEEFPGAKGFSARNLWYMKKWYLFYSQSFGVEKLHQLGAVIGESLNVEKLLQYAGGGVGLHQPGAETDIPPLLAYVPWRHHIEIITSCSSFEEAVFYLSRVVEEGWSRSELQNYLKADLFKTTGGALSNFKERLPSVQARLAQSVTKDIYDFGFLTLSADYGEKSLEDALERNIASFLLELGSGFAFVGRQKEIIVAGKTRRIDMLFYHIHLRCYVVVELKAESFEPEFAGKLNFYVNAVDELLKKPDENRTIGLLICKDKDKTEVRWAFKGIDTPMGVASYDNVRIAEIQRQLPTEEQIQQRIAMVESEHSTSSTLKGDQTNG